MPKPTALELFAAFAAQLPLLTRDDLTSAVEDLRASAGWGRALVHARLQAEAIGLSVESLGDVAVDDPGESDEFAVTAIELSESARSLPVG